MNPVDLASLLCSRLCHDLMSPVGALNNGIELLADETDPEMRDKCLELLADSARASANKLKFFRLAFGAAGGFGEEIDTLEAEVALEGLFGPERRIELGWVVGDEKLPKDAVKLLLNLAMLARAGDPRRRTADPARSGPTRDASARRKWRSGRAACGWRLAGPQSGRRCRRIDPAVQPGKRNASDRRAPSPALNGFQG